MPHVLHHVWDSVQSSTTLSCHSHLKEVKRSHWHDPQLHAEGKLFTRQTQLDLLFIAYNPKVHIIARQCNLLASFQHCCMWSCILKIFKQCWLEFFIFIFMSTMIVFRQKHKVRNTAAFGTVHLLKLLPMYVLPIKEWIKSGVQDTTLL